MILSPLRTVCSMALFSLITVGAASAQQLPCNPVYQPCTPPLTPITPTDTAAPEPIFLPGF